MYFISTIDFHHEDFQDLQISELSLGDGAHAKRYKYGVSSKDPFCVPNLLCGYTAPNDWMKTYDSPPIAGNVFTCTFTVSVNYITVIVIIQMLTKHQELIVGHEDISHTLVVQCVAISI